MSTGTTIRSWALLLAGCAGLAAQVATEANSGYKTPEARAGLAATLTKPDRDATQKPHELVQAMGIQPGMAVADIGTGPGYMLPFLSRAVGRDGRVYAEDIFDDFLKRAEERARNEKLGNVTFVKGSDRDPMLPAGALDLILALDSYHHYDYPEQMLAGFHKALREGGRLVIVEYYKNNNTRGEWAKKHIRLDEPDLVKEVEANRFRLVSKRVHIPNSQYMLMFEKR